MRLLNPAPGELIDRLTILELKVTAAHKQGKSTTYFEAEKELLNERLQYFENCLSEDYCTTDYKLFESKLEDIQQNRNGLAAINALLWRAEDDVRNTDFSEAFKLARYAKLIPELNDKRAEFVHKLSTLYGIESGEEKLYNTAPKLRMVSDIDLAT